MSDSFGASLHIKQLLRILRRQWHVVVACMLLAGLGALTIGVLLPPRYTAKAQIILEPPPEDRGARLDDMTVQTWAELMSTADHVRRLQASMESHPPDFVSVEHERPALTILMERGLAALATLRGLPRPDVDADAASPGEDALPTAWELDNRLRVFKERQSRIIAVTFTWTDPGIAAAIANRSASLFLEDRLRQQEDERHQTLAALRRRIAEARSDLDRTAIALAEYRVKHGTVDPDRADQVDAQIAEITRLLAVATADLPSARPTGASQAPATLAAPLPVVAPGSVEPTPRRRSDVATLAANADAEVQEGRIRFLTDRLAALQEASAAARAAEARLRDLRLESRAATTAYETLLGQELALNVSPVRPQASIVSIAAAPRRPSSPDPIFFVPPALVVGAIGGGLLAVLLQRLDRRVRTERGAEEALGVRCIGVVPKARRMRSLHPVRALLREPFAPYTRAIRSTAMALLGLPGDERPSKVILFTSSRRDEGKTALAVSFAAYAALLHRKVLIVDLDLPSPGLGDLLGAGAGPGAMDVLRGVPLAEAVRRNDEFGIDYLSLASAQVDPLLLMADEKIHALLDEMRERYGCVVIDGGALLGNPEVRVLVALADHVILTLKWGSTDLDTARTAVNELVRARHPAADDASVSSVLTQVEPRLYPSYANWPDEDRPGRRHVPAGDDAGSR